MAGASRFVAAVVVANLVATPHAVVAQGVADRVLVIRQTVELVGEIGEALSKITDGVRTMITASVAAWDAASARRMHARLVDLSANLTQLGATQRIATVPAIENYLATPDSTGWQVVLALTDSVLVKARVLLQRLESERSDLVLESAYRSLDVALRARVSLLSRLRGMERPTAPEELAELRRLAAGYRRLVSQLQAAIEELNRYIASRAGG